MSMQSLHYVGPHRAEWREVPAPKIGGSGEALVRPTAVTACGLDIAAMVGLVGDKQAFPLGHEFIGVVAEIGESVTTVKVGDTVVVPFEISCGQCDRCERGLVANCSSVPHNSMYGLGPWSGAEWGGALSDLVRVPYANFMCIGIDPQSSPAIASLGDNTTDAWRAVGPYVKEQNEPVLSVGAGPIAVAVVAIARALGCPTTFVSTDRMGLALAESLGATVIDVSSYPKRVDKHPITASSGGDADALRCAIRSTESGGVCTDTGIFFERHVEMPLLAMYDLGITFRTGRAHIRTDLDDVLTLVRDGLLKPQDLIQSTAVWADADVAMSELSDKLLITRD